MNCEIAHQPNKPVYLSRLSDLRVGHKGEQFTAPLFAVSSDGKQYSFEFHFEGSCYGSVACFQASQLADLREEAKTRFLEVIEIHRPQNKRLPILT